MTTPTLAEKFEETEPTFIEQFSALPEDGQIQMSKKQFREILRTAETEIRAQRDREIAEWASKIRCVGMKIYDDGVHVDYRCSSCRQEWGEENQTPVCKNAVIKPQSLLSFLAKENK